MLPEALGVDL